MSSDPFKLVTERRFQGLREEARGGQLIAAAGTETPRKPRDAVQILVKWIRTLARARTPEMPAYMERRDVQT